MVNAARRCGLPDTPGPVADDTSATFYQRPITVSTVGSAINIGTTSRRRRRGTHSSSSSIYCPSWPMFARAGTIPRSSRSSNTPRSNKFNPLFFLPLLLSRRSGQECILTVHIIAIFHVESIDPEPLHRRREHGRYTQSDPLAQMAAFNPPIQIEGIVLPSRHATSASGGGGSSALFRGRHRCASPALQLHHLRRLAMSW